jgi:hypothetical protein
MLNGSAICVKQDLLCCSVNGESECDLLQLLPPPSNVEGVLEPTLEGLMALHLLPSTYGFAVLSFLLRLFSVNHLGCSHTYIHLGMSHLLKT